MSFPKRNTRPVKRTNNPVRSLSLYLEKNIWDVNINATCAAGFTNTPLSNVTQGPGFNQRDGAILHPISLQMRGTIVFDGGGSGFVRVLIVRHLYDAATVSATDAVAPLGGTGWNVVGAYNRDFVGQGSSDKRLQILKDEVFKFSVGGGNVEHFEWNIKLSNLIRYLDSNATSVPLDGALSVYYCDAPSGAVHAIMNMYSRLTFTDA